MNVFKLFAKLSLDAKEYEKGLSDAQSKAGSFVSGVKSVVGKAGDVLATVGKTAAAAIGVASTAVSGLAKKSLDAYADFEQLEGGAKLMFGSAYDFIMQKSAEAYSTVQLSQNAYLEQVNGFAVGLKTALGGNEQAAAELADKIITAEADIVSATGNSQEAVQNAFNGIMKSNYTMLDNLQLGIKPTKEGMEEVIDKVNAWNAAQGKATQYTIENLADVQSALVDYVEMQGLAGYAANEASTTIQGSIAGMKSAWQNFLTGTGTPAQLVKSMKTAAGNVVKQIKVIVPQLVDGLKGLAHELVPEIPGIMHDLLPTVIDGAVSLLTAASEELPGMIDTLLPSLISGTSSVIMALVRNMPQILKSIGQAIPIIVKELKSHSGELLDAAGEIFWYLSTGLVKNAENIGGKAVDIILKIGKALTSSDVLGNLLDTSLDIISGIAKGMFSQESFDKFCEYAPDIITNVVNALGTALSGLLDIAVDIVSNIFKFMTSEEGQKKMDEGANQVMVAVGQALENVCYKLREYILNIADYIGKTLVELFDGNMTASELIRKLGEALINKTVFRYSKSAGNVVDLAMDSAYVSADTSLPEDEWRKSLEEYGNGHWSVDYAGKNRLTYEELNYKTRKGIENQKITDYVTATGAKGVPVFGSGGIVTKPTVALIGEDGAEAVVPLEKDSDVGRRFGGSTFNVTIYNDFHGVEDMQNAGEFVVQKIDEALRRYQLQQVRGQGGTAW